MLEMFRRSRRGRNGRARALLLAVATVLWPATVHAQIPGLDEWAEAIVTGMGGRWEGPRADPPAPEPRPDLPVAARSLLLPVTVHAGPGVEPERIADVLRSLEGAWESLERRGWGTPWPDGGRGETGGFDLYLVPGGEHAAAAGVDAELGWSFLDAASSFAVVDPDVDGGAVEACVVDAYAQALLLGLDPAEARAWRRATSSWLAFQLTGRWGCAEHVLGQQQEPWRSWIDGAAGDGSGGALLLAFLSARHDRGTGTFVRDVWQLARQRTWEGDALRASPDLWEALAAAVDRSGDDLVESMEDFAVARWFGGDPARERASPVPILRELPPEAATPFFASEEWKDLPEHTDVHDPPLEPFGSAYARVDTSDAPDGALLRIWLRGEYGVRWSLVAVRLGADGRELTRLSAPPREEPRSYLVLELLDDTEEVVIVVTNLSNRLPDADEPDENDRSFKLILSENPG